MEERKNGRGGPLEARLTDAVHLAEIRGPHFVGFLDEHEAALSAQWAKSRRFSRVLLWGGHPDAERVIFGAFPEYCSPSADAFPVASVTVRYRPQDRLTHRDFLGALLNAGLERSALGDILPEEGRCVLFCREEISDFLCSQITRIGGVGVRISEGAKEPFPAAHRFAAYSSVVAAPRLDCAVAASVGTSRARAAVMIRSRLVEINHAEADSPSAAVQEGDVLSVRGKGRFVIDRLGPVTKKGRLCLAGRKYI